MYTRFVILALIALFFTDSVDARRYRHAKRHTVSNHHRVFEPDRSRPVRDDASPFETGTGRVGWIGLADVQYNPPVYSRVAWLRETQYITTPEMNTQVVAGAGCLSAGLALLLFGVGARVMTGIRPKRGIVLLRVEPGSSEWMNRIRLWCKMYLPVAIGSYRTHTVRTMRERIPFLKSPPSLPSE